MAINVKDLTADEIMLLKMAFKSLEQIIEVQHEYNYGDYYIRDTLFNLKEKLGIYDIVS